MDKMSLHPCASQNCCRVSLGLVLKCWMVENVLGVEASPYGDDSCYFGAVLLECVGGGLCCCAGDVGVFQDHDWVGWDRVLDGEEVRVSYPVALLARGESVLRVLVMLEWRWCAGDFVYVWRERWSGCGR